MFCGVFTCASPSQPLCFSTLLHLAQLTPGVSHPPRYLQLPRADCRLSSTSSDEPKSIWTRLHQHQGNCCKDVDGRARRTRQLNSKFQFIWRSARRAKNLEFSDLLASNSKKEFKLRDDDGQTSNRRVDGTPRSDTGGVVVASTRLNTHSFPKRHHTTTLYKTWVLRDFRLHRQHSRILLRRNSLLTSTPHRCDELGGYRQ